MKTLARNLFLIGFLMILPAAALAQRKNPPPAARGAAVAPAFDYGTIAGNVYTNKSFGLRFAAPEGWETQERDFNRALVKTGSRVVKGRTAQMQKSLNNVEQSTRVLFAAKKGLGTAGAANFICAAESVRGNLISSGTDYLRATLSGYRQAVMPPGYRVDSEIKQDRLGANALPFFEAGTPDLRQRFYAIKRGNYAVFFVLTYQEEADLEVMRSVLTNADFALR